MRHLQPQDAWALIQSAATGAPDQPAPLFLDVRMEIEMLYVGRPPGVEHVSWYEYPSLTADPAAFCAEVERLAPERDRTVILICRSGQRSVDAGLALEASGFTDVVNVLHGFEGDLNDRFHRSSVNGWRFDGLPWEQF
jgi:rhodanese-related sulfurtransferase